ncbi:hypothetical protein ACSBR2_011009 [Camellia fascicularis]
MGMASVQSDRTGSYCWARGGPPQVPHIVLDEFYTLNGSDYQNGTRSGPPRTQQHGPFLRHLISVSEKVYHTLLNNCKMFAIAERWFGKKYPNSGFVNNLYNFKLLLLPGFQLNPLRLCFRTFYVISTTVIAVIFPYFNQVLGVLGALNFWPLAIYFPVEMYFVQKKIGAWTTKWIVLQTFSIVCLIISILALIGSVEGLIRAKLS